MDPDGLFDKVFYSNSRYFVYAPIAFLPDDMELLPITLTSIYDLEDKTNTLRNLTEF